jgi:hypothetical protein
VRRSEFGVIYELAQPSFGRLISGCYSSVLFGVRAYTETCGYCLVRHCLLLI